MDAALGDVHYAYGQGRVGFDDATVVVSEDGKGGGTVTVRPGQV